MLKQHYSTVDKKTHVNSILFVLYLFQYGLLLPFSAAFESEIPIVLFTFIVLFYALIANRIHVEHKTLFLIIVPLLLLLFKLPFEFEVYSSEGHVALHMLMSFMTIGVSGILIGALRIDIHAIIRFGYKFAWVNFFFVGLAPFASKLGFHIFDNVNYMKFGYSLLPTVFFSFYSIFKNKNKLAPIILFLISFSEMFIFGARGATLTFLLFAVLIFFMSNWISKKKKIIVLLAGVLLLLILKPLLLFISSYLEAHNMYSYSITKFINLLNGNSLASTSSGRDVIYETAYSRINDSLLFGSPMNTCYVDTGSTYYHNILLDILVNFGIIGMTLFVFIISMNIYNAVKYGQENYKAFFLILLLLPMGRLIVSSSLWQRPEFWVFVSFCVHYNNKKNIKTFNEKR